MKRGVVLIVCCAGVLAGEPKNEPSGVTAVDPAFLVAGGSTALKIRGFKLKEATGLRFPKAPGIMAEIKERKDAAQPNGLDNKVVGESQIAAEFTLPADHPAGPLDYVIATPAGEVSGTITVLAAAGMVDEKEPNNGFREAQKLEHGKPVRGSIQGDKDVDVYEFPAKAGQKLKVTVTGGSTLLMDPALACYDGKGNVLAMADDGDTRNPSLTFTAAAEAPVFVCVSDAHDKGGEWHSYLLTVEEAK